MKKILILFYALFAIQLVNAQFVTTNPEYPVSTQSVIITLNAVGTGLEGYTGDVYAHTGVTIEGAGQWQNVIGSWGVNTSQPLLTRIATDLYELDITPTINDFYSVESGDNITELCMVFRSADGSSQTTDTFVDVYSPYSITITSPDSTTIYSIGENVDISAVALFANSMTLYVNDLEVATSSSDNISHTVVAAITGKNTVRVVATDGSETLTDSTFFFVREDNIILDLPSSNLKDGINYIDETTVTLVLYAPFKDFVFVNGSFNDWNLSQENQMNQTPDGKRYWITISGLTPAQEYAYQYVIDGSLTVADAYCDKVLDPWNDQYISSETYPDLMDYPEGKTSGIVSVFQTNQTPYTWENTSFVKPAKENLVIYELHIRDFVEARNYQTMIDTLSYLKNLGVDAIELMPINEFEGNSSWGYNPSFHFAVDKAYGTKNKLKEFIDSCHVNGIAVILDMVLNHSYGQLPLVQMYFDPEAGEWGQPAANNPWFNEVSPNTSYSWGYDFNHESTDTKTYVKRVTKYWLEEYKFDGFRFDFTKGFTNTPGEGWAYDQARIDILKEYADDIWNTDADAYVILEHFADNSEETILSDYGMMIWGNVTHSYSQAAMGWPTDWDFSWVSYVERNWTNPGLIGYMESHDEERMMFKNLESGNSSGDYDVQNTEIALQRVELAAAFFFTVPGPKMIWQFEELGYDVSIDDPCRVCEKPFHWEYYTDIYRFKLYSVFKELIKLRKENEVFATNNFTMHDGPIKQIVLEHATGDAVVYGNFAVSTTSTSPKFTHSGMWYDYFSGAEYNIQNTDTVFSLSAGEYKIFTDFKLDAPLIQTAPIALNVLVEGNLAIADTAYGTYTFYDANDDLEATSKFQWYKATAENGSGSTIIEGAEDINYLIEKADYGAYLMLEVTPVSNSAFFTEGIAVRSAWAGPIAYGEIGGEPSLYPNPAEHKLFITNLSTYSEIDVIDISGKVIETIILSDQKNYELTISELPRGLYFIRIGGKEEYFITKFVKY